MNDQDIQDRIEAIELEEQRLRADEASLGGQIGDPRLAADRDRLAELQAELEQLYAQLRARRAQRDAGQDPDDG
jgi:hypothetical protein